MGAQASFNVATELANKHYMTMEPDGVDLRLWLKFQNAGSLDDYAKLGIKAYSVGENNLPGTFIHYNADINVKYEIFSYFNGQSHFAFAKDDPTIQLKNIIVEHNKPFALHMRMKPITLSQSAEDANITVASKVDDDQLRYGFSVTVTPYGHMHFYIRKDYVQYHLFVKDAYSWLFTDPLYTANNAFNKTNFNPLNYSTTYQYLCNIANSPELRFEDWVFNFKPSNNQMYVIFNGDTILADSLTYPTQKPYMNLALQDGKWGHTSSTIINNLVRDSSGNVKNGTISGIFGWNIDNGLYNPGSNDIGTEGGMEVTFPTDATTNTLTQFTFSLWYLVWNTPINNKSYDAIIFSKGINVNNSFWIEHIAGSDKIRANIRTGGGVITSITSTNPLQPNIFNFISLRWSSGQGLKLSVNGGNEDISAVVTTTITNSTTQMKLGSIAKSEQSQLALFKFYIIQTSIQTLSDLMIAGWHSPLFPTSESIQPAPDPEPAPITVPFALKSEYQPIVPSAASDYRYVNNPGGDNPFFPVYSCPVGVSVVDPIVQRYDIGPGAVIPGQPVEESVSVPSTDNSFSILQRDLADNEIAGIQIRPALNQLSPEERLEIFGPQFQSDINKAQVLDQYGVKSTYGSGQIRYTYEEDFSSSSKRWDVHINSSSQYVSCEFTIYMKASNSPSDEVSIFLGGGKHSSGSRPRAYVIGVDTDNGNTRLRVEEYHPDYTSVGNGSKASPLNNTWRGYRGIIWNKPNGVLIEFWQDNGNNEGSTPANQWTKYLSILDTKYNWRNRPSDYMNLFRVDGSSSELGSISTKWFSMREILSTDTEDAGGGDELSAPIIPAQPSGPQGLQYLGGPVYGGANVYIVFDESAWNTRTNPSIQQIKDKLYNIHQSGYYDALLQYGIKKPASYTYVTNATFDLPNTYDLEDVEDLLDDSKQSKLIPSHMPTSQKNIYIVVGNSGKTLVNGGSPTPSASRPQITNSSNVLGSTSSNNAVAYNSNVDELVRWIVRAIVGTIADPIGSSVHNIYSWRTNPAVLTQFSTHGKIGASGEGTIVDINGAKINPYWSNLDAKLVPLPLRPTWITCVSGAGFDSSDQMCHMGAGGPGDEPEPPLVGIGADMLGKEVKKASFWLRGGNTPNGTGYCRIWNFQKEVVATLGSFNAANVSTSNFQRFDFSAPNNKVKMERGFIVGIEYNTGTTADYLHVQRKAVNYDSSVVQATKFYQGAWKINEAFEIKCVLILSSMSPDIPEWHVLGSTPVDVGVLGEAFGVGSPMIGIPPTHIEYRMYRYSGVVGGTVSLDHISSTGELKARLKTINATALPTNKPTENNFIWENFNHLGKIAANDMLVITVEGVGTDAIYIMTNSGGPTTNEYDGVRSCLIQKDNTTGWSIDTKIDITGKIASGGNSFEAFERFTTSKTIIGEKIVNANSTLRAGMGRRITRTLFKAKKIGFPTGTMRCGLMDVNYMEKAVLGTIDVSTIGTTGYVDITFSNSAVKHLTQDGDRVFLEFIGATAENTIEINMGRDFVDGQDTIAFFVDSGSTYDIGNKDMAGTIFIGGELDTNSRSRITQSIEHQSSEFKGLRLTRVILYLFRTTSNTTGTGYVNIRRGIDDEIMTTLGSVNVSTLSTNPVNPTPITFTNLSSSYVLDVKDRISFEFEGGNTTDKVGVMVKNVLATQTTAIFSYVRKFNGLNYADAEPHFSMVGLYYEGGYTYTPEPNAIPDPTPVADKDFIICAGRNKISGFFEAIVAETRIYSKEITLTMAGNLYHNKYSILPLGRGEILMPWTFKPSGMI